MQLNKPKHLNIQNANKLHWICHFLRHSAGKLALHPHCSRREKWNWSKDQVHLYSTTTAASATLSSQTEPVYSLSRSPSPRSQTLACSHTAIRSSHLHWSPPPVIHENTLTYWPKMDGRLSWLTYRGWVTHKACKPKIRHRAGKFRQTQSDILTIELRRQPRKACGEKYGESTKK